MAYRIVDDKPSLHHGFFVVSDDFPKRLEYEKTDINLPTESKTPSITVSPLIHPNYPRRKLNLVASVILLLIFIVELSIGIAISKVPPPEESIRQNILHLAEQKTKKQKWDEARVCYNMAKELTKNEAELLRIDKEISLIEYNQYLTLGQEKLDRQEWDAAIGFFIKSGKYTINSSMTDKINQLICEAKYQKHFTEGNFHLINKEWSLAKISFQDCLTYKNGDRRAQDKLDQINRHLRYEEAIEKFLTDYAKILDSLKPYIPKSEDK